MSGGDSVCAWLLSDGVLILLRCTGTVVVAGVPVRIEGLESIFRPDRCLTSGEVFGELVGVILGLCKPVLLAEIARLEEGDSLGENLGVSLGELFGELVGVLLRPGAIGGFLDNKGVVVGVEETERDLWLARGVDTQLEEPELIDANDVLEDDLVTGFATAPILGAPADTGRPDRLPLARWS